MTVAGGQPAVNVPGVRLRGLRKEFGHVVAVDHVDLDVAAGEFFAMLGPSGSGKTTVLRMIAGFEEPTAGTVHLGRHDVTRQPPFRRGSLEEASADLGATGWQTFRLVTFPMLRTALVAGGLLAFGLSFDEIVVTTFTSSPDVQTLPLWIFGNLFRPNQAPVVNVVAAMLIILAVLPVWLSQRLGDDAGSGRI
jgi:energy-coupling factor transporter ATP-binding protein EcfA2